MLENKAKFTNLNLLKLFHDHNGFCQHFKMPYIIHPVCKVQNILVTYKVFITLTHFTNTVIVPVLHGKRECDFI